ncbi:serine protease inhibitor Kazal-type 2 [Dipodomys spectabilis]|uniref:serine protease inhibitor Kazal-type 2 n=1 Tax=Dipodomys spectabilis TaxID=105255 RepID=UPI001C53A03C|nr:serine protease inhibitor Kazal-type 2 [Dipodomys spectabilis]
MAGAVLRLMLLMLAGDLLLCSPYILLNLLQYIERQIVLSIGCQDAPGTLTQSVEVTWPLMPMNVLCA